ncbi:Ubiquitin-like protein 1-40S ribosomal protein S27a [Porphyridium purpureum]|uniref:Ubiquitin-like protein 1-40S ribosomal protein S27a n=1 Tax=Porphyridium purpureum TaxID=35688 RepID=A0A5J4Z2Z0_PORPP|nr:Ubiquitin-like protein 1-40S ribosomal protein S27a [Porphyridium purpureum]|eukprot:POR9458..scf208_2
MVQVLVRCVDGRTQVVRAENVRQVREQVAAWVDAPAADWVRLNYAGKELCEDELALDSELEDATLFAALRLMGGGKKRKKKTYTKPKKIKHKHKKVKLAVLKFYKVSDDGKVTHLRRECPDEGCGAGIFMAKMKDREYCGKCHLTLVESN